MSARSRSPPMWMLLLLPFVGLLWVPFYNSLEPALFGFPFFYWYQLAWVPISSLLIWLVYRSPDSRAVADLARPARRHSSIVILPAVGSTKLRGKPIRFMHCGFLPSL